MKTTLIFFDSEYNSGVLGTARGAIAIIPILICTGSLIPLMKAGTLTKIISVLIVSLILCSVVGVQIPRSYKEVVAYNGLVGIVLSVCLLCASAMASIFTPALLLLVLYIPITMVISGLFTRSVSLAMDVEGEPLVEKTKSHQN